jgi:hypothetical protein
MITQTQTFNTIDDAPILRRALLANAIFSFLSGLLFTLRSTQVAEFLGIQDTRILGVISGGAFILELGIGILVFAGVVAFIASRPRISKRMGTAIVIGDCIWVVASIVLMVTKALPLTTPGFWAVMVVTDIVLAFAIWEFMGVRRKTAA